MSTVTLLLHGTTASRARSIVANRAFAPQRTFFALGLGNRDLARLFAQRIATRFPREGPPTLVLVTVPGDTLARLRALKVLRAIQFDPEDRPELRRRMQWVLEPGGIEMFNRDADEWRVVPRDPDR